MIASLRGRLIHKDTNRIVLDVQGVGYSLGVSLPTSEAITDNGEIFLHVHTAVRETALELFGFIDEKEKTLFEMLIGVSGVGPKSAIAILSGITPEGFKQAILSRDIKRLSSIQGVGKKSAERLVLDLSEKISKLDLGGNGTEPEDSALEDDLTSSLVGLGYKERIARAMAARVVKNCEPETSVEEALKVALKMLTE